MLYEGFNTTTVIIEASNYYNSVQFTTGCDELGWEIGSLAYGWGGEAVVEKCRFDSAQRAYVFENCAVWWQFKKFITIYHNNLLQQ